MWGRNTVISLKEKLLCLSLFIGAPIIVIYAIQTAFYCNYDVFAGLTSTCVISNLHIPNLTTPINILTHWILFQCFLFMLPDYMHRFLPFYRGGIQAGSVSPGGYVYRYNINGFQAWIISIICFLAGNYWNYFSPTIIYDNWGGILTVTGFLAYIVTTLAYIKAHIWSNYPNDLKFTGCKFYDYFMGVELNPRFSTFDLKLFLNGRPGIIGWSLINLSFAAVQKNNFGYISNSMYLVIFLQTLYIGYFFLREAWYLKTLDISHDHFGWMFSFGDLVWLPATYTLQGLYLANNPIQLSTSYLIVVLLLGCFGFYIFASSNNEKDNFKNGHITNVNRIHNNMFWCRVNGIYAKYIPCSYETIDGKRHDSKLLISGWWKQSRHINYTGDIILSLGYSLACGYDNLFPYFYVVYLTLLLLHRTIRDEEKCRNKYGNQWNLYCKLVPYRFIRFIV